MIERMNGVWDGWMERTRLDIWIYSKILGESDVKRGLKAKMLGFRLTP